MFVTTQTAPEGNRALTSGNTLFDWLKQVTLFHSAHIFTGENFSFKINLLNNLFIGQTALGANCI